MRTILVATDFSANAARGVDWAAALALRREARLVVAHAFVPRAAIPHYGFYDPLPDALLKDAAARSLDAVVGKLAARGLAAAGTLRIGPAAPEIVSAARREKADLVVIGTRGATGFRHLLLGSTTEKIMRLSEIPVLAVHPRDPLPGRVRTILVPVDFSTHSRAALREAARLLDGGKGRIILFHACPLTYDAVTLGDVPPARFFAQVCERVRRHLERDARPLRARVGRVDVHVRLGFPLEGILREARGADLIAMGTHGRRGMSRLVLGSTAERVIQHARCPVLAVKAGG